jgi:hypothetical protein
MALQNDVYKDYNIQKQVLDDDTLYTPNFIFAPPCPGAARDI